MHSGSFYYVVHEQPLLVVSSFVLLLPRGFRRRISLVLRVRNTR